MLLSVNQLLDGFFKERNTKILVNEEKRMMFSPVDNALGRKNQKYLADVKAAVYNHLSDEKCSVQTNRGRRRIKVSWMYPMD